MFSKEQHWFFCKEISRKNWKKWAEIRKSTKEFLLHCPPSPLKCCSRHGKIHVFNYLTPSRRIFGSCLSKYIAHNYLRILFLVSLLPNSNHLRVLVFWNYKIEHVASFGPSLRQYFIHTSLIALFDFQSLNVLLVISTHIQDG